MPAKRKNVLEKLNDKPFMSRFSQGMELMDLIEKGLEKETITIDCGGHFRGENHPPHDPFGVFNFSRGTDAEVDKMVLLKAAIESGTELQEYVKCPVSYSYDCPECSEQIALEFNGKHFRCCNPCKYPKGMPPYDIFLNVPSGKMVVANDLREYFPVIGDYSVNYAEGCKKTTEMYAAVGMAHAMVLSTCPSMYKVSDRKFVIGVGTERNRPVKGARQVASICTDLWWYSIVDYDQFVARAGREPQGTWEQIVKVEPGVYRFRHRFHQVNDEDPRPQIYTHIDRVRKPDPVVDFQAEWMKQNFTAGQIIWGKLNGKYGDLYTEDVDGSKVADVDAIMHAADTIMCTSGAGGDYHPNGWIGYDPELKPDCPALEIPIFTKKYRWYPWSESSRIPIFAGIGRDIFDSDKKKPVAPYLNPSFLALACNICQCIVRYGSVSMYRDSQGSKAEGKKVGEREEARVRKLALRSLKAYAKKYPDQFPEYCRELLKEKA